MTLLPVSLDPGDTSKLLSLCGKAVTYKFNPREPHDSYKKYSYGKSTFTVLSRATSGHPCHMQLEAGWPCQGPGVWTWRQAASMSLILPLSSWEIQDGTLTRSPVLQFLRLSVAMEG